VPLAAFGANGDGAGEDGDDVAEGSVADLQAGLQGADIPAGTGRPARIGCDCPTSVATAAGLSES